MATTSAATSLSYHARQDQARNCDGTPADETSHRQISAASPVRWQKFLPGPTLPRIVLRDFFKLVRLQSSQESGGEHPHRTQER